MHSTHPSSPPFFITGGTLSRDAQCYVVRKADQELYNGLYQGHFCYVLTSRQMGKSSLMVRTAVRLRDGGAEVILLDLTGIGQNLSAEQWYGGLLTQIAQQLGIEEELEKFWDQHPKLGPLQRWMEAITQIVLSGSAGQVVIFIDEIDAVRSLPFSTDEFFAGIREFYNRRTQNKDLHRLTFCLLGVASPADLIRDSRTTPFNIGRRIELRDFTGQEAARLTNGFQRSPEISEKLLNRVLHWTNGHPYLTQRLSQAFVEEAQTDTPDEIDRLCQQLFLSHQAQERDDNLLFVRERLLRSEADLAGLLTFYKQVTGRKRVRDDVTNPLISILRLSGVTREHEGFLYVKNRIYQRVFDQTWIRENMPDAETRRQRAAYRRGLIRAAAVFGLIIALIGSLAFIAVKQRDRATAEARRADLSAEEARGNLAEAQRQQLMAEEEKAKAERQRREAVFQQQLAEEQRDLAEHQKQANNQLLYAARMNLAGEAWEAGDNGRLQELLKIYLPKPGQRDLRGLEWYLFWPLSFSELATIRHTGKVKAVAFSPNGKILATGCDEKTILWNVATGQELASLEGPRFVNSLAFSPDGKNLAIAGSSGMKIWDIVNRQELAWFRGYRNEIYSIAFSPDGKYLATNGYDSLRLWDLIHQRELRSIPENRPTFAFSPDGASLAVAGSKGIKLLDVATGREGISLSDNPQGARSVVFSPDGKWLFSGGGRPRIGLWNASTGQLVKEFNEDNHITSDFAAFSPDSKILATTSTNRSVILLDVPTGLELATLKGHSERVYSLSFSPDGQRLATASEDHTVKLWDVATIRNISPRLGNHKGRISSIAFSLDGKKLATAGEDQVVKLWDVKTGRELSTFYAKGKKILAMAITTDGTIMAAGDTLDRGAAKLWNITTDREVATIEERLHSATFSFDNRTLAVGTKGLVKLFEVSTGKEIITLNTRGDTTIAEEHFISGIRGDNSKAKVVTTTYNSPTSLAFSPDGRSLAIGMWHGSVGVWETATGLKTQTFKGHSELVSSLAFSPDGKRLVTGSHDRTVKLWDVMTGQELGILKGHTTGIQHLAFSPDGKRLATGDFYRTYLWDLVTAQQLTTFHSLGGNSLMAFSPDGKTWAMANTSDVRLWRIAIDQKAVARNKK
jgi:WD40 repeat protein